MNGVRIIKSMLCYAYSWAWGMPNDKCELLCMERSWDSVPLCHFPWDKEQPLPPFQKSRTYWQTTLQSFDPLEIQGQNFYIWKKDSRMYLLCGCVKYDKKRNFLPPDWNTVPFIKVVITTPSIQPTDMYNCNEYRHIAFI